MVRQRFCVRNLCDGFADVDVGDSRNLHTSPASACSTSHALQTFVRVQLGDAVLLAFAVELDVTVTGMPGFDDAFVHTSDTNAT